ncbi:MAG: TIGR02117 family protein [Planctomycetes bacterium]|nr:TIGR02117 family protein [Planctomycetota bacterium]
MSDQEQHPEPQSTESASQVSTSKTSPRRAGRIRRFIRWPLRIVGGGILLFLLAFLIGLIPVNQDFQDSPSGIEVFIYKDEAHSAIIVPVNTKTVDWRKRIPPGDFVKHDASAEFIRIGWGDRDFFLNTQEWSDVEVGTTLKALFLPSRSAMHVEYRDRPVTGGGYRRVVLSESQFKRLTTHIWDSFQTDDNGRPLSIPNSGYGAHDLFYEAQGRYFFLNTCNNWTGRGLKKSGVRTGLWTPFALGL